MDELRTTSPAQSFLPEGSLPQWDAPHQIRHASLPSESVCTENLTPFLKLLPCKSLSGIASLLNPHRLFDADWHGMSVHVLWREKQGVEVRLTFQSIFDPLRTALGNKQGDFKFPISSAFLHKIVDWSFQSLFDRNIDRACPVAETSEVIVSLPVNTVYTIKPEPSIIERNSAKFDVKASKRFCVFFHIGMPDVFSVEEPLQIRLIWRDPFSYRGYSCYPNTIPFSPVITLNKLWNTTMNQCRSQ